MTTAMKGLLKGLRFISRVFDTNSKEHEMQIGNPTDVKHLAHIGWDGTVNTPTWMKEFETVPNVSSGPLSLAVTPKEPPRPTSASQELGRVVPLQSSPRNRNRARLHHLLGDSVADSLARGPLDKPVRHHHHALDAASSSPHASSESSTGSSRRRRSRSSLAPDSSNRDSPRAGTPSHSGSRRAKGSSSGSIGSTSRASRSKAGSIRDGLSESV